MNGKLYEQGDNPFYYAENFLIRTPIPLLLFIIFSLAFFRQTRSKISNEIFLVTIPIFIFIYFSAGNMWSGIRYLLPVYPFLFIFMSKTIKIKDERFSTLICVLLAWFIISSLLVFPNYLTYFNEAVGGPSQGYNYFVGGSFDVGQDLKSLGVYIEKNNIQNIKLAYFGAGNPEYYGFNPIYLIYYGNLKNMSIENCEEQKGIIAASITYLQPTKQLKNPSCLSWLRKYKPKQRIGNTIFLYEVK